MGVAVNVGVWVGVAEGEEVPVGVGVEVRKAVALGVGVEVEVAVVETVGVDVEVAVGFEGPVLLVGATVWLLEQADRDKPRARKNTERWEREFKVTPEKR